MHSLDSFHLNCVGASNGELNPTSLCASVCVCLFSILLWASCSAHFQRTHCPHGHRPFIKNPSECGPAPLVLTTCFSAWSHFRYSVRWTEDDWRKRRRDNGCSLRMKNCVLSKTQSVTRLRLARVAQSRDFLLYFSQSQLSQDAGELPAHYEFPGDAGQETQHDSDPNLCQQVQEEWWLSRSENILTITSEP